MWTEKSHDCIPLHGEHRPAPDTNAGERGGRRRPGHAHIDHLKKKTQEGNIALILRRIQRYKKLSSVTSYGTTRFVATWGRQNKAKVLTVFSPAKLPLAKVTKWPPFRARPDAFLRVLKSHLRPDI